MSNYIILSFAEIHVTFAEGDVFQTAIECIWLQRNADLCDTASSDRNRRITLHIDNLTVLSCNLKLQATIVTLWKNNFEICAITCTELYRTSTKEGHSVVATDYCCTRIVDRERPCKSSAISKHTHILYFYSTACFILESYTEDTTEILE